LLWFREIRTLFQKNPENNAGSRAANNLWVSNLPWFLVMVVQLA
jgi:hypothetical protein